MIFNVEIIGKNGIKDILGIPIAIADENTMQMRSDGMLISKQLFLWEEIEKVEISVKQ